MEVSRSLEAESRYLPTPKHAPRANSIRPRAMNWRFVGIFGVHISCIQDILRLLGKNCYMWSNGHNPWILRATSFGLCLPILNCHGDDDPCPSRTRFTIIFTDYGNGHRMAISRLFAADTQYTHAGQT